MGTNLEHDAKHKDFLYTIGVPIDYQLDEFYVSEWGVKGYSLEDEDFPHWIKFINSTIAENGIRFNLTPGTEQENLDFDVYFKLTDLHPYNPQSTVFEVTIKVLMVGNFSSDFDQNKLADDEKNVLEIKIKTLEDQVDAWQFKLIMSHEIKVPANYTDWSNQNEG